MGQKMARAFAGGEVLDLASLRKLPAKAIMGNYENDQEVFSPQLKGIPKFDWFTIVDGLVLPESVHDIFSQGKQADVPVLIGSNDNEAITFNEDLLDPQLAAKLDYRGLMAELVAAQLPEVGEQVYEYYPVSTPARARQSYIDFWADFHFTQPMRVWADMMARVNSDVYLYWWNWRPSIQGDTRLKAFHMAEIPHVFGNLGSFIFKIDDLPEDRRFSTLMMQIWTNFAKTGDPSVEGLIEWPVHSAEHPEMLVLGPRIYRVEGLRAAEVKLITDAYEDRRRGWSKVPE